MTLLESTDGLSKLESNGICAYIDPKLLEYLKSMGDIQIDYITTPDGRSGYSVRVGAPNCGDCSCPHQESQQ